jgi:hypothetical protein
VSVGVHLGHIEPRHAPGLEPLPLETSVLSRIRIAVGSPGAVAELGAVHSERKYDEVGAAGPLETGRTPRCHRGDQGGRK